MLQNVGDTCVVWGISLEADGKDIVLVISRNVQKFGTGLVVLQLNSCELELGNMLRTLDREAMQFRSRIRVVARVSYRSIGSAADESLVAGMTTL